MRQHWEPCDSTEGFLHSSANNTGGFTTAPKTSFTAGRQLWELCDSTEDYEKYLREKAKQGQGRVFQRHSELLAKARASKFGATVVGHSGPGKLTFPPPALGFGA